MYRSHFHFPIIDECVSTHHRRITVSVQFRRRRARHVPVCVCLCVCVYVHSADRMQKIAVAIMRTDRNLTNGEISLQLVLCSAPRAAAPEAGAGWVAPVGPRGKLSCVAYYMHLRGPMEVVVVVVGEDSIDLVNCVRCGGRQKKIDSDRVPKLGCRSVSRYRYSAATRRRRERVSVQSG